MNAETKQMFEELFNNTKHLCLIEKMNMYAYISKITDVADSLAKAKIITAEEACRVKHDLTKWANNHA